MEAEVLESSVGKLFGSTLVVSLDDRFGLEKSLSLPSGKVLQDMGLVDFPEPFPALFTQGMIYRDGAKMSKSKGNVVTPDEICATYGADTARLFVLFVGPPEQDAEWSAEGVEGSYRFIGRVWRLVLGNQEVLASADGQPMPADLGEAQRAIRRKTHQTIQRSGR